MIRFYNISTTYFQPISFENVYLYTEYNKIKNFLVSQNQEELLKVLAIPSYIKNNIEWSADTKNEIKKLDQFTEDQQVSILSKYNKFQNSYNSFIDNLRSSKNQDNKNWGELLFSLIQGTANELFFDGEHIYITWGWRLLDENNKKLIPVYRPPTRPSTAEAQTPIIEVENDEPEPEEIPVIDENESFEEVEKSSWLDRFYLFFKKLWWLIPIFSVIILILVLLKSCENNECDPVCVELDSRIDSLGHLLDSCECLEGVVRGCMDKRYQEYNPDANVDDKSCKNKINPCGNKTVSGGFQVSQMTHALGDKAGFIKIRYNMFNHPDKMEVYYNDKKVTSTYDVRGNIDGNVGGKINSSLQKGELCFNYDPAMGDSFCTVVVTGGSSDTSWQYWLDCPASGSCR